MTPATVRLSSLLRYGQKTVAPHQCLQRVGDVDPGGVVNHSWAWWVIKTHLNWSPALLCVAHRMVEMIT